MPVFSPSRRRAIVMLLLTSILLLTLDLRGNALVSRARDGFSVVLQPFVTAGDVIATPVKNAWHGATDYQELQRENERLREQIAQQRGDDIAARAILAAHQEIIALQVLAANYPRVTARVVGDRTSNFSETIEIDRGSADAIKEGMAVISRAGLVGKITKVYPNRSIVRLITDAEYAIECKVTGVPDIDPFTGQPIEDDDGTTEATVASGMTESDLTSTTAAAPPVDPEAGGTGDGTTTGDGTGNGTGAGTGTGTGSDGTGTNAGGTPGTGTSGDGTSGDSTSGDGTDGGETGDGTDPGTTTTTLAPELVLRETGGCQGRGRDRLPVMRYVTENPAFSGVQNGDVITTAGGSASLVPPDIAIGVVINRIERTHSAGPLLEIELAADLDHLNFVQVVLYQPPLEASG
ncbi:MAG TPA: rod shape-determining protein MreC [Ilumatobacteraceae bacterium]|nr:rod shape-determining protein MreC [Ilumatobacteraceae bacterium]